jgi:hypothetical protein
MIIFAGLTIHKGKRNSNKKQGICDPTVGLVGLLRKCLGRDSDKQYVFAWAALPPAAHDHTSKIWQYDNGVGDMPICIRRCTAISFIINL